MMILETQVDKMTWSKIQQTLFLKQKVYKTDANRFWAIKNVTKKFVSSIKEGIIKESKLWGRIL